MPATNQLTSLSMYPILYLHRQRGQQQHCIEILLPPDAEKEEIVNIALDKGVLMRWISANDLQHWASKRDCQSYLPYVIRRLIRGSNINFKSISFPAVDSVQFRGWDGVLKSDIETEYIPEGDSVWEISANKKIKEKAESDFNKRTKSTKLSKRRNTTFVFVTPHIWEGKIKWTNEKINKWRNVKVYDGRDLEEWLEETPAVGGWLARHLNLMPEMIIAADEYWNDLIKNTMPNMTADLIISGREIAAKEINNWILNKPSTLNIQASTKEEALAFLLAVVDTMPEDYKNYFYSRCLIVNDQVSFREISKTKNSLIIVVNFNEVDSIKYAFESKHHIYIPIDPSYVISINKLILPRPKRDLLVAALVKMGMTESVARTHSKESGRSFSVLKRRLSGIHSRPDWAKQDSARDILPALFLGRWNEKKKSDKIIVSKLAHKKYNNVIGTFTGWLLKPDCPFYKIGDSWRLTSPLDAWFALAPYITSDDLKIFENIVIDVLGINNPIFDLENDKRFMAAMYGKEMPYSDWIRDGIAQSLILIAIFGQDFGFSAVEDPQLWADNMVGKLFYNADWKKWSSLSDVMRLLAEASPTTFLDAVEQSLSIDDPEVMGMFSDKENDMFSSSPHNGLLWALESLAWDPNLLGRVSLVLAHLSKLDPGGKLANRPFRSLREIFLLWHRNTYASFEQKIKIIDILLERESIGWGLLISLIPGDHDFSSPTQKYRWRQVTSAEEKPVTIIEFNNGRDAIIDRLLIHTKGNGERWAEIIERLRNFPVEKRLIIFRVLADDINNLKNGTELLRHALRKLLSIHRSHPDTEWALPKAELKLLTKFYNKLEPSNLLDRYNWLFDNWPEFPEGYEGLDYQEREKVITERRIKACLDIIAELKLEGIFSLTEKIEDSWELGLIVAQLNLNNNAEQLLYSKLDNKENAKLLRLVQGYTRWSAINKGVVWAKNVIQLTKDQAWSIDKIINYFVALPEESSFWNLLQEYESKIQNIFWEKCWGRFYHVPENDRIYGIKKLLEVNRIYIALNIARLNSDGLPAELIYELLHKAAITPPEPDANINITAYDINNLLKIIDNSDNITEERKVQLEWAYLSIVEDGVSEYSPRRLHKEIVNNPSFFAELLTYAYKPKTGIYNKNNEGLAQETIASRARRAYNLLSSCRIIPGQNKDGIIDYNSLHEWVVEARRLCKAVNRQEIGDEHIGQILAWVKKSQSEVWPPEPICRLIEEVQSGNIELGFKISIMNQRGATTRALDEGGKQERQLAQYYKDWAQKNSLNWPRISSVLLSIANDYESQAKRQDNDAEARDLEH